MDPTNARGAAQMFLFLHFPLACALAAVLRIEDKKKKRRKGTTKNRGRGGGGHKKIAPPFSFSAPATPCGGLARHAPTALRVARKNTVSVQDMPCKKRGKQGKKSPQGSLRGWWRPFFFLFFPFFFFVAHKRGETRAHKKGAPRPDRFFSESLVGGLSLFFSHAATQGHGHVPTFCLMGKGEHEV